MVVRRARFELHKKGKERKNLLTAALGIPGADRVEIPGLFGKFSCSTLYFYLNF